MLSLTTVVERLRVGTMCVSHLWVGRRQLRPAYVAYCPFKHVRTRLGARHEVLASLAFKTGAECDIGTVTDAPRTTSICYR